MKKLLLIAAVAVFTLSQVNAQDEPSKGFNKGDFYLSGYASYDNEKFGSDSDSELIISPSLGYFVTDNIALDVALHLQFNKYSNNNKFNGTGLSVGGTYFFTPASQFSFTLGARAFYYHDKNKPEGNPSYAYNTVGASINPGINYFISNKFALNASIGALSYSSIKGDWSGAQSIKDFNFSADLSDIWFGLTYKL